MCKYILIGFLILCILACALSCALSCASIFWFKAGQEDGFTLEAFDFGPSPYWTIGMLAFFVVLTIIAFVWKKIEEAGYGH